MALFPVSSRGVSKEQTDALIDVQSTCHEYGVPVHINLRGESNVTRDKYNSIKKHNDVEQPLIFMANPVQYNPSIKQLEKAGIAEPCEVVIYTAMQDWTDNDLIWDDIDVIRTTVVLLGNEMLVKSKGLASQYGDYYLYITLGLVRK